MGNKYAKILFKWSTVKIDKRSAVLSLSRADIANMAGTTYETTIRTLANFEKLKLIELVGKEIAVKNASKLDAFASDKTYRKKTKTTK